MKLKPFLYLFCMSTALISLYSCDDIIEPSISKSQVQLEAPTDQFLSTSYAVNFWWDEVNHALSYHLQVVTPNFSSPTSLVLDTTITGNKFTYTFSPGNYQWRVMAENGSSQTAYTTPRNFTVASSSITTQMVLLGTPANNYLTNQANVTLTWGSLYGATKYQVEIDTNNFVNENSIVLNETIPGLQLSFTFPKDQTYQWRIKAENDTAQAKWSSVYSMTYDNIPPPQVTLSSPSNGGTVSLPVSLQWNSTSTAVSYKLYVFQSDSTTIYNSTFPVTLNTTSYTFNLGNSGSTIYWRVYAVDAAGNVSQPSALRSFVLQ
jgi:hypothetical protein